MLRSTCPITGVFIRFHQPIPNSMSQPEQNFFTRADNHIYLANEQLATANKGEVSASMLYGTARFNAWVSAGEFDSPETMKAAKEKTIAVFLEEYQKMLSEHLDDYIENFHEYVKPK